MPNNHRSISLISCIGNLMEWIILKHCVQFSTAS